MAACSGSLGGIKIDRRTQHRGCEEMILSLYAVLYMHGKRAEGIRW